MGRKKKKPIKVFCYYCEREFDDESVLVQHQKAKHFKCHACYKQLSSGGGLKIHVQQVHRELLDKVPNALPGRDSPHIDIFGMQGIPAEILAAHYGEDASPKQVNVEIPEALGVTYPAPLPYGAVQQIYNPVGVQSFTCSHPPQPQPWAPQRPAYPMPPAAPALVNLQPQPASPIQNVSRPSIHNTAPGLQPSFQVSPTSIPSSTSLPTSHPHIPSNNHSGAPLQNPPILATTPPSTTPASSPTMLNSSLELKSMSNIAPGSQRLSAPGSQGLNTPAPTTILEVYLLWEDEVMSMEERRLGLPKYQVRETSQIAYTGPAKKDSKIGLPARMTF